MDLAIETRALSKSYKGVKAINNVYLAVPHGSIFGLFGPKGAGKSTLIQILAGIIRPNRGQAFILGCNIRIKDGSIRNRVGYVPDEPVLYPGFTVNEMYRLGSKLYPFWDWERCRELHEKFSLPEHQRIRNISGGQRAQVALTLALALRPRLLLWDKTYTGLDPEVSGIFQETILEESASRGTTIFYTSYKPDDLEQSADHFAVLCEGQVMLSHSLKELKELVHSIQLVFTGDPPEDKIKLMPGLVEYQRSENVINIIITGYLNRINAFLALLKPDLVKKQDLDHDSILASFLKAQGYEYENNDWIAGSEGPK